MHVDVRRKHRATRIGRLVALICGAVLLLAAGNETFIFASQAQTWRNAVDRNIRSAVRRYQLDLKIEGSAGSILALAASADNRFLATVSQDLRPRLWDLESGRQLPAFPPLGSAPRRLAFASDGSAFVTVSEADGVVIWDIPTLSIRQRVEQARGADAVGFSPDGTLLAFAQKNGEIRLLRRGQEQPVAILQGHAGPVTALSFGASGQFLLSSGSDYSLRVWEVNSGVQLSSRQAATVQKDALFGKDETEFFSRDDKTVMHWSAERKEGVRLFESGDAIRGFNVSSDAASILVAQDRRAIVISPGKPGLLERIEMPGKPLSHAHFDATGKQLFTAADDGIVKVWDRDGKRQLVSLISTRSGWAVVDEKGRFDGSAQALEDVRWASDTGALPLHHFSEQFFEPGLLQKKRLGSSALLSSAALDLKDGILPPPESRLSLPEKTEPSARGLVSAQLDVKDMGGGIDEIRVFHNGKALKPEALTVRSISKGRDDREERRLEILFAPVSGLNLLLAAATSSEKVLGPVARAETAVALAFRQPVLHLLTVGINRYRDASYDLNYARPDAETLIDALAQTVGPLFSEVRKRSVFDEGATAEAIRATLGQAEESNPEDVVILYIASHGEASADDFFVLPSDFQFPATAEKLRQSAVSFASIRAILQRIGARRVILLVDACKSGAAVASAQDQGAKRVMQRLGAAVGLHIIAATAREQFAVEVSKLGHGVFTYALVQGIYGQADADPKDGNVTVAEIARYLEEQVPVISRRFGQAPQWPLALSTGLDFTLTRPQAAWAK
jgi:WD40 repeat protein